MAEEEEDMPAPGAARRGNFVDYYRFNPAAPRLRLLPDDLPARLTRDRQGGGLTCLDVGCNTGVS